MSVTLLSLIQQIARDGYGYISITPSAAGAVNTVVSNAVSSQLDPDDADTLLGSAWLKCESDSAATPLNVGEVRRLDAQTGYTPSTGTLTTTRNFSNASTITQTYGVYAGIPPDNMGLQKGVKYYVNSVLRRLFYHRPFLLTLVTDGDMETSGVTNWTATNSTRTKSTSTGVTLGKQALRVQNSALNGYVQSATVNVEPGQTYALAADVTVASGTAVLELWDVTNGASIETETCVERQSRRVWLIDSLPTTCRQVAVRLGGQEATADAYWDNVALLNINATEMPMPSWFKNAKWLEYLKVWQAGAASSAGTDKALDDMDRLSSVWAGIHEDKSGVTPYRIQFSARPTAGVLFIGQSLSPFDELSADSDSCEADADWICAWALALIAQDRQDENMGKRWLPEARRLDRQHQARWAGKRYQHATPYL